jgi:hypothetical protein
MATCGSKLLAAPSGTGKIVRKPWIVSNANSSGMCKPRLLDRDVLKPVDLYGIGDTQHRAEAILHLLVGDQEVGSNWICSSFSSSVIFASRAFTRASIPARPAAAPAPGSLVADDCPSYHTAR